MVEKLPIYMYHGTFYPQAKSILDQGFLQETFFTIYLDSALVMGGPFVFKVYFKDDEHFSRGNSWQYRSAISVPKERIIWLRHFKQTKFFTNDDAEISAKQISISRENTSAILCTKCRGNGQLENYDEFANQWKQKLKVTICQRCKGYGFLT